METMKPMLIGMVFNFLIWVIMFLQGQRLTITISNNLLIDTNPEGTHWNNMLYNYGWTESANARFVIYNNIFVNRKIRTGVGGIAIGRYYEGSYSEYNSIYFLNNTIISKGILAVCLQAGLLIHL